MTKIVKKLKSVNLMLRWFTKDYLNTAIIYLHRVFLTVLNKEDIKNPLELIRGSFIMAFIDIIRVFYFTQRCLAIGLVQVKLYI